MIKLYLDFDGVILNTIDVTYADLEKKNITDLDEIDEYYKNLDWFELIDNCEEINNSISNIKKIIKSNLYDVNILTHIKTKSEIKAKEKYLKSKIKDINLITVQFGTDKCDVVDCKNAILVDDYIKNLEKWYKKGGIPIKFSDKGKKCKYMSISSLDNLLEKYDEIEKLLTVSE